MILTVYKSAVKVNDPTSVECVKGSSIAFSFLLCRWLSTIVTLRVLGTEAAAALPRRMGSLNLTPGARQPRRTLGGAGNLVSA